MLKVFKIFFVYLAISIIFGILYYIFSNNQYDILNSINNNDVRLDKHSSSWYGGIREKKQINNIVFKKKK